MRKVEFFKIPDLADFKIRAIAWAGNFSHFSYLNPNQNIYLHDPFPEILAIGAREIISFSKGDPFEILKEDFNNNPDWLFGYFGYDLKNKIEDLSSQNIDWIQLPDIYFYRASHLLNFNNDTVKIESNNPYQIFEAINKCKIPPPLNDNIPFFRQNMLIEEYKHKVQAIRNHILEGDIYEMNFCQEFFSEDCEIDPLSVYQKLNEKSPMPFSVFSRFDHHFLICASPERFLKKSGIKLISQPIKGTTRRGENAAEDRLLIHKLRHDEKELAENLMIVDLVRNDLAKSSKAGSVKVEELFGIYTFPQVHQMISTITSTIKDKTNFSEAIKNAFPMGSMTGAPKIKVMELIEKYENSKRGLYSGAFGFIDPNGDFDFNVVIRSLIFNSKSKVLSFMVGSAITYDSDPDQEYQECLLKAKALREIFTP
ncbi:anthranilate synthase component I family protein [soil metagenome]